VGLVTQNKRGTKLRIRLKERTKKRGVRRRAKGQNVERVASKVRERGREFATKQNEVVKLASGKGRNTYASPTTDIEEKRTSFLWEKEAWQAHELAKKGSPKGKEKGGSSLRQKNGTSAESVSAGREEGLWP